MSCRFARVFFAMALSLPIDSSTIAQLQSALQTLTPPEVASFVSLMQRRFNLRWSDIIGPIQPTQRGQPTYGFSTGGGAGGAGNFTINAVANPAGSGKRILVLYAQGSLNAAAASGLQLTIGADPAFAASFPPSITNNGLVATGTKPVGVFESGTNNAVLGTAIEQVPFLATVPQPTWVFQQNLQQSGAIAELTPGTALMITSITPNEAVYSSFTWTEVSN
jgi:hypothetical protein